MLSSFFTENFLRQLAALQINSRRSFLGLRQGNHISPRKGHGIEFSQYRQYQLGDNPRLIDWNVYARTERLYVKQYQEEEDLLVATLIDSSLSMKVDAKYLKAIDIACAIAYVALNQKDTVIGSILGGKTTPAFKRLRSVHQFAKMLTEGFDEANQQIDFSSQVQRITSTLKFPGVVYLISDFFMSPEQLQKALQYLRAKNYFVHLVQIYSSTDTDPYMVGESGEVEDSESGQVISLDWSQEDKKLYDSKLAEFSANIKQICNSFGMKFSCYRETNNNLEGFILKDVLQSGGLL